MKLKWETVIQESPNNATERLKVPGGWIICRISGIHMPQSMAMTFVPDSEPEWDLSST